MFRIVVALSLAIFISGPAAADCDCTQHLGACQASGRLDLSNQTLTFRAGTNQCAQITYSVDGEPGSITITGGTGSTDYLVTNPGRQPKLDLELVLGLRDDRRRSISEPVC